MPLVVLPITTFLFRNRLPAWGFMWLLAAAVFAGLKWQSWWETGSRLFNTRSIPYLLAWPGMDAKTFLDPPQRHSRLAVYEWLAAMAKTLLGIALLWGLAHTIPPEYPLVRGWIGLFGLILLLHFGTFHLLALFWQLMGVNAQPIMDRPLASSSLSEFWGKRWNLGFRQLAFDIIFRPLHRRIGVVATSLLVFLASGLIHDLVISVPARGGYGLPTAYFLLQGIGVSVERSAFGKKAGLRDGITGWLFLFVVAAGPAFWLFHPPFVMRVILPFMHAIRAL